MPALFDSSDSDEDFVQFEDVGEELAAVNIDSSDIDVSSVGTNDLSDFEDGNRNTKKPSINIEMSTCPSHLISCIVWWAPMGTLALGG